MTVRSAQPDLRSWMTRVRVAPETFMFSVSICTDASFLGRERTAVRSTPIRARNRIATYCIRTAYGLKIPKYSL